MRGITPRAGRAAKRPRGDYNGPAAWKPAREAALADGKHVMVFPFTVPLDGQGKMSKSKNNTIDLDACISALPRGSASEAYSVSFGNASPWTNPAMKQVASAAAITIRPDRRLGFVVRMALCLRINNG